MKKSIAKNSVYNIVYTLINLLFPLIVAMYASRILNPAGVGKVAYGQNIVSYFLMIAQLGMASYGAKEIARSSKDETSRIFSELFIINLVATCISTLAFLVVTFAINDSIWLMLACGLQLLFNAINIEWLFIGMEDYKHITIRNLIVKVVSLLFVLLFVKKEGDYIIYALISSMALGLNHVYNLIYSKKFANLTFKKLNFRRHYKTLIVLGISTIMANIYLKIDVTMIRNMLGDVATGYYTNAQKLITIITTICISISAVLLPRLSTLYKNDKTEFYRLLNKGFKITLFFTIPATIGTILISENLIFILFGEKFLDSSIVLIALAPLIIIKGVGDLMCYQLSTCVGKENIRAIGAFLGMISNVILNILFIKSYGIIGAVIATLVCELIVNCTQFIYLHKKLKFDLPKLFTLKICLATLAMVGCILILKSFKLNTVIELIVTTLFGTLVYGGCMVLLNLRESRTILIKYKK